MRIYEVIQQLFQAENTEFVAGLFREFLNHDPASKVQKRLVKGLKTGQQSKWDIFKLIIQGHEFEQLCSQGPQLIHILHEVMAKEEYEFITNAYAEVLGEQLPIEQIQHDFELLRTSSRLKVLHDLLLLVEPNSTASIVRKIMGSLFKLDAQSFIISLYRHLLDRNPDNEEIALSLRGLDSGIAKQALFIELIHSDEFTGLVQKHSKDSCINSFQRFIRLKKTAFINGVYTECYGRDPRAEELRSQLNWLKTGTPRVEIVKSLLLSKGTKSLVQEMNKPKSSELWPHMPVNTEFRAEVQELLSKHHFPYETNILVKSGGLGDFVQMTSVAKALKTFDPSRPVAAVINHSASLLNNHPFIDLTIEYGSMHHEQVVKSIVGLVENVFDVRYVSRAYGSWHNTDFYEAKKWFYDRFPRSGSRINDLNMHVSDIMLCSLGLDQFADCNDVFIQPDMDFEKIPGDYVVVSNSPGSKYGDLKAWSFEGWHALVAWLHIHGIIPVQLGLPKDPLIHPGVMDLRGRTTPRQAAGYLTCSRGYVGIEGGLFNLAKAVGTSAVVIFTATPVKTFAYPDTRVVTKNLCQPCIWSDLWGEGKCWHGCKACMNTPDPDSVIAETARMLNLGESNE